MLLELHGVAGNGEGKFRKRLVAEVVLRADFHPLQTGAQPRQRARVIGDQHGAVRLHLLLQVSVFDVVNPHLRALGSDARIGNVFPRFVRLGVGNLEGNYFLAVIRRNIDRRDIGNDGGRFIIVAEIINRAEAVHIDAALRAVRYARRTEQAHRANQVVRIGRIGRNLRFDIAPANPIDVCIADVLAARELDAEPRAVAVAVHPAADRRGLAGEHRPVVRLVVVIIFVEPFDRNRARQRLGRKIVFDFQGAVA